MSAKVVHFVAFAIFLAVCGIAVQTQAAEEAPEAVVLVPDRMLMVEYGFNIARTRDVLLVSYRSYEPRDPLLLHVWDGRKWAPVTIDNYKSGAFLPGAPSVVIAIGDDTMLPGFLSSAPSWCPDLRRMPTMNIGELVNQTATILNFRDYEWKAMARIYNLSIVDLNTERRKYGKYGPPGTEVSPPAGDAPGIDTLKPIPQPEQANEQIIQKKAAPPPDNPAAAKPTPVPAPVKAKPAKPAAAAPAPVSAAPSAAPATFDMPLGSEAVETPVK